LCYTPTHVSKDSSGDSKNRHNVAASVSHCFLFSYSKILGKDEDHNAGRRHSIQTDNSSSARVEVFKMLATTLKNQNSIQGELKMRLK